MMRFTGWGVGGSLVVAVAVAALGCAGKAEPPKKSGFAEDTVPKNIPVADVKFDPERAMNYLKRLCDIGPRVSGTEGMKKQQELIEKHFAGHGAKVARQEFKAKQHSRRNETAMANLVVTWHPEKARRVIICSHYDTRPIADMEAARANWNKPFLSANDGTSGVAWMMEMAHHMKGLKTEVGVDFVLFDGEEYVFETAALGGGDKYFFGSEHFAADYLKSRDKRKHRYEAGVLLDLFAGKGASLKIEQYSYNAAPKLCEQVWGTAMAVGAKSFKFEPGPEVQDDHLALNRAGIPCIDLIDLDYPHWHKLSDTPDKVSGEQMAEMAKVLATWVTTAK